MNIASVLIAAALAGIAAAVAGLLANKLVPKDKKNSAAIRTVVVAASTGLVVALWAVVPKPFLESADDFRTQIEREIASSPVQQIFVSMKTYDAENYEAIIEELVKAAEHSKSDAATMGLLAGQTAARYTAKYIQNANTGELRRYLETYTAFLASVVESEPLIVCELENPVAFGPTGQKAIDRMSSAGLFAAFDGIVASAVRNPSPYDEAKAQDDFSQFLASYGERHPDDMMTLSEMPDPNNIETVHAFARAYVDVYRDLLLLDPETSVGIYKLIRSSV